MEKSYPREGWEKSALTAIVFAGAITGQLSFGYVGDLIGRNKAMMLTSAFTVIGAVGSALFSWGGADATYITIVVCRFALGVGVGGVYPLSAVKAAEESSADADSITRATRVAWAFFWQTPGSIAPFLVAMILEAATHNVDIRFRLLLGLGAVPAFICWVATFGVPETREFVRTGTHGSKSLLSHMGDRKLWVGLLGTGGSWFLYDVCYYGTALFAPDILEDILGEDNTVTELCWHAVVSNAMGIPGVIATILIFRKLSLKKLQMLGFVLSAVAYTVLAVEFQYLPDLPGLQFATFCYLIFTLNFGPNVTTFVLPQEMFPTEVRSTFGGLSAAMAKFGAVVGVLVYGPLAQLMGLSATLLVCACVSLAGVAVTWFFIVDERLQLDSEDDKQQAMLGGLGASVLPPDRSVE